MTTLGLVTIGQAPRVDLTPEIVKVLPDCSIREYGALDHLDAAQIRALEPTNGEGALTSRLRDGGSAVFSHQQAVPLIEQAVARAEHDGVDRTLIVCTGTFPRIRHRGPLFVAERLAHEGVRGLLSGLGDGRLGIVRPLAEQVDDAYHHWADSIGVRPSAVGSASPYTDSHDTIAAAAAVVAADADLVVLDCIGFDEPMRQAARQRAAGTGAAIVTVRDLAARLLGALI